MTQVNFYASNVISALWYELGLLYDVVNMCIGPHGLVTVICKVVNLKLVFHMSA